MQYHPRRVRNEIVDANEIEQILTSSDHVTLALCNDGVPYVVTMSYGYDRGRKSLYFHCANKGDKLDFIEKNGNTCGTIIKDNGYLKTKCDHDYESLIIRGKIMKVEDLEEKKHGLQVLLSHLEDDPKPIFDRNIKDDGSYDKVTILRLDMTSVVGKKYIG